MTRRPYRLDLPDPVTTGVVIASPHSGRAYDWDVTRGTVLDRTALRSSEDAFVDRLVASAPAHGAPLIAAEMPRAFLDLNRAPEELDPALVRDVPRGTPNPRVSSGLGVIPRVVAQGRSIYSGKISREEARDRIETVWRPYHARLGALMDHAHALFGTAVLIDCHSMPHEAIAHVSGPGGKPPEIVLGDRFGASAGGDVVDAVEAVFAGLGFRVTRNAPFAGAYVCQAYGAPAEGRHAVQVEIDRALYMDEARVEPSAGFEGMRRLMDEALGRICAIGRPQQRVAAE